jgi:hypothetical protein
VTILFLDGINNPGFSGGPIVHRDLNQGKLVFRITGVVSGFHQEFITTVIEEPVAEGADTSKEDPWRIQTSNGRIVKLTDAKQLARTNTGIVIGYHIRHAIDLIKKHPVGRR